MEEKELVDYLFSEFMANCYKNSYGIRDNCGIAAIDLREYFIQNKVNSNIVKRVKGYFLCDIPVHNKKDFTLEMKTEFNKTGLDFNIKEDRLNFIRTSVWMTEWKKCPHYWVEIKGQIYDPSGIAQFINTRLSPDIDKSRYIAESYD